MPDRGKSNFRGKPIQLSLGSLHINNSINNYYIQFNIILNEMIHVWRQPRALDRLMKNSPFYPPAALSSYPPAQTSLRYHMWSCLRSQCFSKNRLWDLSRFQFKIELADLYRIASRFCKPETYPVKGCLQ